MKKLLNMQLSILKAFIAIFVLTFVFSCSDDKEDPFFTVILDSNGGTNFAPINVKLGNTIPQNKLFPPPIIDDGGTFVGWYLDAKLENEYDLSTPVTNDMILYAKWFYVTHTVSFVMNGASSMPDVQVREGSQVELENPKDEKYIFAGWYVDSEFTKLFNPSTIVMEDITLYARWVEESPSSWFEIDSNGVLVACNPPDGTTTVIIPKEVKVIPAWFVLANGLTDIQEFILPENLDQIGKGAFKSAGITAIKIPAKVKTLEPVSFQGCNQLLSFTFAKNSQLEKLVSSPNNDPVITSTSLEFISFPPSLKYVGKHTMNGCNALKIVTFERDESPVIFYDVTPGGVWLFGAYFPNKIRVPNSVKNSFITEMRKVMQDYEFNNMSRIVEGY